MAKSKRTPQTPAKIGLLGGLLTGLGSVVVAQRLSSDIASSTELTLLVVVVGVCLGGGAAFLIARAGGGR